MIFLKRTASLLLLFTIGTLGAFAQTNTNKDISDGEIKQFVEAVQGIQAVEMSAQQKMMGEVAKEDMEVERFNEILQSMQNPEMKVTPPTEDESKKIQRISQSIQQIQMNAQQEMQTKIEDSGLTIERYQAIMTQVQSDPKLQNRIQQSMQPE